MNKRILIFELVLIAAAAAAFAILFPRLPASVPVHWDLQMQPNGYGSRWSIFWLGPAMMAFFFLWNWALPWLSPRHFDVERFRATFHQLILIVIMLPAYFFVILLAQSFETINAGRAIMGGVCLLIALIGNLMGKVRRNFYIGIRTPWTIASEKVWNATHRFGAKTMVLGGLIGLLLAAFGFESWSIAPILIGSLAPVFYSLAYYKKLEKRGELEGAGSAESK
jgi:uncharacterized membrane protein